jgi:hypothetical protein
MSHHTSKIERHVSRLTARKPDNAHHPTGGQQITNARQPGAGIDVMQTGYRRDEVEGAQPKRIREEVAPKIGTARTVVLSLRVLDARSIKVDTHHLRHVLPKLADEQSLAAPNIKSSTSAVGNRSDDMPVIMRVVVPASGLPVHSLIMSRATCPSRQPQTRPCGSGVVQIIESDLIRLHTSVAKAKGRLRGTQPKQTEPGQASAGAARLRELHPS